MANKRNKIMDECPEGFEDELKVFIDDIESELSSIKSKMDIDGLDGLSDIEDAYDLLSDLTDSLY